MSGPSEPSAARVSRDAVDGPVGRFDAALDNLVRQFARPLDCLRELVQNSIDAGTPRVEVTLGWAPAEGDRDEGLLSIQVRDFGEGMDAHIIEHELTRMFASSKADDLSKIGRFGIGFTSVFAIAPELVHVQTGRHGAGWELVFHPDRSFDTVPLDTPVHGTTVTLLKRTPTPERARWVRDVVDALRFWCEHCQTPVLLHDRTHADPTPPPADDGPPPADPFAAFATAPPSPPQAITRPLDLPGATWRVHRQHDGIDVWVGLGRAPAYRWYNGGLTLLSTVDPGCLGPYAPRLGHLRFKVQHHRLEHTLTRDNVIQDAEWERAVQVLLAAADALEAEILADHAAARDAGRPLLPTLRALATMRAASDRRLPRDAAVWTPQVHGPPVQIQRRGPLPEVAAQRSPLTDALQATGVPVVVDLPEIRELWAAAGRTLPAPVDERWVVVSPEPVPDPVLAAAVDDLLRRAGVRSLEVRWCRVVGPAPPLALTRAPTGAPMRRDHLETHAWTRLMGQRTVWIHAGHPNVRLAQQVARLAPNVAAYAVLQGVFAGWDALGSRRFSSIRAAVQP